MTRENEEAVLRSAIVLTFDICSSSRIVEDLILSGKESSRNAKSFGQDQEIS
jgi:hypothetical protein